MPRAATAAHARIATDRELRAVLDGVRALILDADGVLTYRGEPIPGSREALLALRERRIPHRVVTNFSTSHRSTLAKWFGGATNLVVDPSEIITAASSAAAYTARTHPGARLLVLAAPDARREWDGQNLVSPGEADEGTEPVAAVVIGDAGEDLSFHNLDIAFRQLRHGAEFVAMHRNPWWMTPKGFTLDSGAIVAGLEFALGRRAVVCGKPSPVVFREAVAELDAEAGSAGGRPLRRSEIAMVGDDPVADIAAAKRVGLRGILVLTGKTRAADIGAARLAANAVAGALRDVVRVLASA